MEQVLTISGYLLLLTTALNLMVRFNIGDSGKPVDQDGLPIGLRFPVSKVSHSIEEHWGRSALTMPFAVVVAGVTCGSCQPLLEALGTLVKTGPEKHLLLLLSGQPDLVEAAKNQHRWEFPVLHYSHDLERALETYFVPMIYVMDSSGRIVHKGRPKTESDLADMMSLLETPPGERPEI